MYIQYRIIQLGCGTFAINFISILIINIWYMSRINDRRYSKIMCNHFNMDEQSQSKNKIEKKEDLKMIL